MKQIFDFTLSLFLIILLFPLFILIGLAIVIDSPGNPFFLQNRVGQFEKSFKMIKFRSMVKNASKLGTYQTSKDDSRITRIGSLLRKTSLDEIPQLINVLKGEMSLVGPRPDVLAQKQNYTQEQWTKRISVKPGITGLAQALVRNQATPGQRTALDLEYVDKKSFWLDLKIIGMTIKQVILKGSF